MFSMDYILANLPVFKTQRVLDILRMFQDVFEDIFPFQLHSDGHFQESCENTLVLYDLEYGWDL